MTINDKLKALDITLPPVSVPAAAYVPFVQTGKLVFLSGHIARKDGKPWVGQFGKNITTAEGQAASRAVASRITMGSVMAPRSQTCSAGVSRQPLGGLRPV